MTTKKPHRNIEITANDSTAKVLSQHYFEEIKIKSFIAMQAQKERLMKMIMVMVMIVTITQ